MVDIGLKGKVALITGANHGIGAATARAFARQGAAVFVTYLRRPLSPEDEAALALDPTTPGPPFYYAQQAQTAEMVVQDIRNVGGRADAWEADLADSDSIPTLFDRAEAVFGHVDVLVNNAAYCVSDTFLPANAMLSADRSPAGTLMATITAEAHDRHFAVNSRAVALMMAEFARRHIQRGATWGRIINVSTDGASAFPGEISYGASKHALESYSRSAALELGKFGLTVNVVSLGPVQTGWMTPAVVESEARQSALGRVGQPEDVADVIVFFASEQARWVTGQLLYVGGGHVMPL